MKFFRYDSAFWTVTGRIFDLLLLNILWFVTSLPILTMGAASAALSSVTLRMVRGEDPPILKSYFSGFAANWKSATGAWLICLPILCWLIFGVYVCADLRNPLLRMVVIPETAMLILCLLGLIYLFPVCVEYQDGVLQSLKRALYLSLLRLPWTALLVLTIVLPVVVTMFVPDALILTLMLWIFLGAGGISYVHSLIFKRLFEKQAQMDESIAMK